jgi:hypothetical protein
MFLLMITTSAAWVFPNSRVPQEESANSVPSTLEMHRLRVRTPRAAAFFALLTLPSTARAFILRADQEQSATTSTVRLGPQGYVASAQHEMPAAATIKVRGRTTCRRSVPFL